MVGDVVGLLNLIVFRYLADNRLEYQQVTGQKRCNSPLPPHTITSFPYRPWFRPFSSASFAESRTAKTCADGDDDTDRLEMPSGRNAFAFSESTS